DGGAVPVGEAVRIVHAPTDGGAGRRGQGRGTARARLQRAPDRSMAGPMSFSDEEVERYARHLVLAEIGGPGQQALKAASVLIVGAGGVGGPAAQYLAAAGVGRLGIIDHDAVALSNLQRQVIFDSEDIGRPKVAAAAGRLGRINPHVAVEPLAERLTPDNARPIVARYDLALDGTDDFATRLSVNAACVAEGRPLVSGALGRWGGQVGVFE